MAEPKQPQDHLQPAAQREVEGDETVVIEYGEEKYTFPASLDDADGGVIDAVDDQKLSYALRALMSAEDWKRFKATKPKVRDYDGLFGAYAKEIGLETTGN